MRADDVGELGRVGDQVAPALAHAHLRQVLQDVKTDALKHDRAGVFEGFEVAQFARGAFHAVTGGDEKMAALDHTAALEQCREMLHFEE